MWMLGFIYLDAIPARGVSAVGATLQTICALWAPSPSTGTWHSGRRPLKEARGSVVSHGASSAPPARTKTVCLCSDEPELPFNYMHAVLL